MPNSSKSARRYKKRASPKPQEMSTASEAFTPLQLEQIELAKQLDVYIGSFQKKLLLLTFKPSDRELIILFIMSLHPRWRRFIEPVELSFSTWLDAAKCAKSHCRRVSAMLGCENDDQDAIFKSTESKILRDSGFFSQDFCLSDPNQCIQKLLISPQQQQNVDKTPATQQQQKPKESTEPITKKPERSKTSEIPKPSSSTPKVNITLPKANNNSSPKVNNNSSPKVNNDNGSPKVNNDNGSPKVNNDNSAPKADSEAQKASTQAIRNEIVSQYTEQIETITDQIIKGNHQSVTSANGTDKEVLVPITRSDNSVEFARIPVMREEDKVDGSEKIIESVPHEHQNVNLTFLELTVNGKKVKALLAKLRWGSSAISMDCAKRLELPIRISDDFGILTDFGYVDAEGDIDFPVIHPNDARLKKNLRVCILPKIYGGKVDMVLGADFFFYFQPALNIQKRTISFLGKETPYLVNKLT